MLSPSKSSKNLKSWHLQCTEKWQPRRISFTENWLLGKVLGTEKWLPRKILCTEDRLPGNEIYWYKFSEYIRIFSYCLIWRGKTPQIWIKILSLYHMKSKPAMKGSLWAGLMKSQNIIIIRVLSYLIKPIWLKRQLIPATIQINSSHTVTLPHSTRTAAIQLGVGQDLSLSVLCSYWVVEHLFTKPWAVAFQHPRQISGLQQYWV